MTASRPLSAGEIELARTIFGDAIDYSRVKMIRRKWAFFQPKGIVMAPNGHIYFHPKSNAYRDDFSKAGLPLQGLFIHEMTHVWQAQKGGRWFLPLARHPFCRYRYEVKPGRPFKAYGLEQQAEIVRHAFLAQRGHRLAAMPPDDLLPFV